MRTAALLIVLTTGLAACSISGGERTGYESDAGKAQPLEVPPGLALPKADDRYTVPDGGGETSASYSEYAKGTIQGQVCVCKEPAAPANGQQAKTPVVVPPAAPKLQDMPDSSKSILLGEAFDRCWLRVEQALDAAGIAVEDKDRSGGQLFLKGGKNQVTVKTTAAGCEVAANNGSGATNSETRRIIEALYKKLGK